MIRSVVSMCESQASALTPLDDTVTSGPGSSKPASAAAVYVSSQLEGAHSSHTMYSPAVRDPSKRPCLPNGPADTDDLLTESVYTFANYQAWYARVFFIAVNCNTHSRAAIWTEITGFYTGLQFIFLQA